MKRDIATAIALVIGLALAGTAWAQGRHDDRPHGYDKRKAEAAAATKPATASSTGGRHDERPHGVSKPKTTPAATAARTKAAPDTAPEAAKPEK